MARIVMYGPYSIKHGSYMIKGKRAIYNLISMIYNLHISALGALGCANGRGTLFVDRTAISAKERAVGRGLWISRVATMCNVRPRSWGVSSCRLSWSLTAFMSVPFGSGA